MEHSNLEVFETPDVPEGPQQSNVESFPDAPNSDIDQSHVSADAAFKKFADKTLDTSLQDYSDSLTRRRRLGLVRHQTDFELAGGVTAEQPETPLQKFHRLQFEVKSLTEELNTAKDKATSGTGQQPEAAAGNTDDILTELHVLERQLRGLLDDRALLPVLRPTHVDSERQQDLTRKIVDEIQGFASRKSADAASTPASTPAPATSAAQVGGASEGAGPVAPGTIVYELYYSQQQAQSQQVGRAAALERRLDELERVLGPPAEGAAGTQAGLAAVVEQLRERVGLLGVNQIEQIQRRLKVVNQDIDATLKKSQANLAPTISPHDKKISELFELMTRWDAYAAQVPAIVTRLQALKELHVAATSFRDQTRQLAAEQEHITKLLQTQGQIASQVESSLASNMATVQANVTSIQERFDALSKRIDGLKL
eukprot:TRINITY_DN7100_c0_g1_i1.p1 TRINITY_DN7100_c0_g1~~TRINITY_DN7100_c0_g1_i1.p1  ORF type:complete len:426 (-),score=132.92 TRINITY_DN7100_c0_g1_i1:106-1383(-)